MKKIGFKKIILLSISVLASILLIVGLSSKVLSLAVLPSVGVLEGVAYETGFSLLDFNSIILDGFNHSTTKLLVAIICCLMLVIGLLGAVLNIIGIFKFEHKKWYKIAFSFIVVNLILSVCFLIFSIFIVVDINKFLQESLGAAFSIALSYKTTAYLPLIFEIILLVAFLICKKILPDTIAKKEKKLDKEDLLENTKALSFAERESVVIDLLKKYKSTYSQNIITIMDFEKRKYTLLFDNLNVDLEEEAKKIEVLISYHKIYGEGIITIDEFEKKKLRILFN